LWRGRQHSETVRTVIKHAAAVGADVGSVARGAVDARRDGAQGHQSTREEGGEEAGEEISEESDEKGLEEIGRSPSVLSAKGKLRQGKLVINPQFDSTESFAEGLALARIGDKWGSFGRRDVGRVLVEHSCARVLFGDVSMPSTTQAEDCRSHRTKSARTHERI
jgi:hypothetical protein